MSNRLESVEGYTRGFDDMQFAHSSHVIMAVVFVRNGHIYRPYNLKTNYQPKRSVMHIFTVIKEIIQSISKGFGMFFSERGGYVDTAYTPGLSSHKK